MSDYAVVNPATGETVKEYPTITDDDLRDAIARADEAHRELERLHHGRGARGARAPRRRAARRAPRASSPRSSCARWASRSSRRSARSTSARRSTSTTPTTRPSCWPTSRSSCSTATARRSSAAARSARCSGSCRGTSPTTRWRASPGPNLVIGNTILLKHAPQCPESAEAMEQIFHEAGLPRGRVHQHLRDQRADRVGHRRPARAGRLADRLRARRRGGRRDRRAQPQEGRARARRLGPVHPARHRRPRRRRRDAVAARARQHRPVLQRGQALHRRRRALRAVPGEVHGRHHGGRAGRPDAVRHGDRPAVVVAGDRSARAEQLQARGRRTARRSSPAATRDGNFFKTDRPDRHRRPTTTPTTRSSSARSRQVYRVEGRGRGGRARQRHARTASARTL